MSEGKKSQETIVGSLRAGGKSAYLSETYRVGVLKMASDNESEEADTSVGSSTVTTGIIVATSYSSGTPAAAPPASKRQRTDTGSSSQTKATEATSGNSQSVFGSSFALKGRVLQYQLQRCKEMKEVSTVDKNTLPSVS